MNNLEDAVFQEVEKEKHVVIISPLFKKIFYLTPEEGFARKFHIEIITPENVSHNSFYYTDLLFRSRIQAVLPTGKLRIYDTKEEADNCIELWTSVIFEEAVL